MYAWFTIYFLHKVYFIKVMWIFTLILIFVYLVSSSSLNFEFHVLSFYCKYIRYTHWFATCMQPPFMRYLSGHSYCSLKSILVLYLEKWYLAPQRHEKTWHVAGCSWEGTSQLAVGKELIFMWIIGYSFN